MALHFGLRVIATHSSHIFAPSFGGLHRAEDPLVTPSVLNILELSSEHCCVVRSALQPGGVGVSGFHLHEESYTTIFIVAPFDDGMFDAPFF